MPPAPLLLFADTTVILNFGLCGTVAVLGAIVGDRGAWTATIEGECRRKEREMSIVGTADDAEAFLGESLRPEDAEHARIRRLRAEMARPGDHRDQHLGEAELVTILESRQLRAVIVTDDGGVAEHTSITCITTWDLLGLGVRKGIVTPEGARAMRAKLLEEGRVHVPEIRDLSAFESWLADKLSQAPPTS